jgi:hypothetical protein
VSVAGVSNTSWDSTNGYLIINTADGGSYYTTITLDPYTTSDLSEGTNLYYTTVRADSDARYALTGSTGITYDPVTGILTSNDGQIVHDNLSGFVANEHVDHSLVSIIAGNGLQGGGDITSSRTLSIDSAQIKGLFSSGTGVTYNSGTGSISIGQAVGTGDTPTFNGLSANSARITSLATPSASTDAANKGYVDEVAQGLKAAPAVEVATTANLSATYDNGTLGVGSTLTSTTNGAFPTIDGVTVATTTPGNNGVLVKNQSSSLQNGRYNLTQVGDASNPWILTRCGVCDQSSEIPGSYVFVTGGDNQANTGWTAYVTDTTTFTVGTDNITYFQFSGAGTYTAGLGLELNGSVFSLDSTNVVLSVNSLKGNITATNLLDAIKTVDGASSGLDADLLDGQQGSYYRINVYDASGTLLN